MSRRGILREVREISNEIADALKFELVDLEYVKEFGSYFLRVYIDKIGGITIDECQEMSQLLSDKLDELDLIEQEYYLEVSSPGLDRPLKTDKDLRRNIGRAVEISLYRAFEKKKTYEGELTDYNDEDLVIVDEDKEEINIPREYISNIKLKIIF